MQRQLIRLPDVRRAVGLSRSELYRRIKLKQFPRPVPIGERAVAWDAGEIQRWVEARIRQRDAKRTQRRAA